MEAVFDHSWRLLADDERQSFAKLSVFQGTFTRRAAQHITGASLTVLTALVDKSLLYLTADERYQMHELLRQYAAQKLTETQQVTTTRDAYSDYYLNALAERETDIKGRRQLESLNEIETDFENVRAAWNWAIRQGNFEAIDSALESIFWYCAFRSRFQEGTDLFGQTLENFTPKKFAGKDRLFSKIQARRFCLWAFGYMEPEDAEAELERYLQIA
jgi:predicted ATPase